jgi:hypothetical protein
MAVIFLLLIMSASDNGVAGGITSSGVLPFWSMAACEDKKKELYPKGSPDAICVAFKSEEQR